MPTIMSSACPQPMKAVPYQLVPRGTYCAPVIILQIMQNIYPEVRLKVFPCIFMEERETLQKKFIKMKSMVLTLEYTSTA